MTAAGWKILTFAGPEQLAAALADGPVPAMVVQTILRPRQTPVHIFFSL